VSQRTDTTPLPLRDRLCAAHSQLVLVYERRNGFLSDDDVLDTAELWTTTPNDCDARGADDSDYRMMVETLFDWLSYDAECIDTHLPGDIDHQGGMYE
jgi:hypothetical protein